MMGRINRDADTLQHHLDKKWTEMQDLPVGVGYMNAYRQFFEFYRHEVVAATAVYPRAREIVKAGQDYVLAGFLGELGELSGVASKRLRGDDIPDYTERMSSELGDALWFLAALCVEFGLAFDVSVFDTRSDDPKMTEPFFLNRPTWEFTAGLDATPKLVEETVFAGFHLAWAQRMDTDAAQQYTRRLWLNCLLRNIDSLCAALGTTPVKVIYGNAVKQLDRLKRNKIKGDGDKR